MINHSLREYLEQKSSSELDIILHYLVNNCAYTPNDGAREVLAILEKREKERTSENV